MMQRYRHQELRKRRQEAEQLLHGFRGYYDESFGAWSPRKDRRHRSSFGLGYGMDDSLTDPDVLERRQTTMPRLQHEWGRNEDDNSRHSQHFQPNPLDPNRTDFLHDTRHYDGTRYPRTSQEMDVSNGVKLFSDESVSTVEQRGPGYTSYKGRYSHPDMNSEDFDGRIDTSGSEERLRDMYSGRSVGLYPDGTRAGTYFNERQSSSEMRDGPPADTLPEQEPVQETVWRDFISDEPGAKFPPEAGRYHLYASYACPGSHRALIVRALKGLEDVVSVTIVHPTWRHTRKDDPNDKHRGWIFGDPNGKPFHNTMGRGGPFPPAYPGNDPDPVMKAYSVRELYEHASDTAGKYTVPLLWDKKLNTIVNNESSDISYMLNSCLNDFAKNPKLDLYTEDDEDGLDRLNDVSQWLYPMMIHGVYRCGFARTQAAYDRAIDELTGE
jgi:Glutathione S-transferase, N-terminal domain